MDNDSIKQQTERVAAMVIRAWGRESLMDHHYRARRVLEEAVELAQSLGVEESQALSIVMYVYSRKVGWPAQELAGTASTLLSAAHSLGIDLADELRKDIDRVNSMSLDTLQAKHESKARAGV